MKFEQGSIIKTLRFEPNFKFEFELIKSLRGKTKRNSGGRFLHIFLTHLKRSASNFLINDK